MSAFLRPARHFEIEGNRLRLFAERFVSGGRSRSERGFSSLWLSPTGDPAAKDYEATVTLPIDQSDALIEAAAAFNAVMDRHEASP